MSEQGKDVRCRIGKHHYVGVMDDNPEKRGHGHLECTRCGHIKDLDSHQPMSLRGVTHFGAGGGFGG